MSLEQTLTTDIAVAMKSKNAPLLSTLRMLKAALMNKSVEKNRALDEAEELQVVSSLVKQRRDSVEQFTAGGRQDLADREKAEIAMLQAYLPPAVGEDELQRIVADAVVSSGATTARDMGKAMKAAMTAVAGKTVDAKQLSAMVKARLQ